MNKKLKKDLSRAFRPLKKRGKKASSSIGRDNIGQIVSSMWLFVFSFFILAMRMVVIGIKKVLGVYS